MASKKQKLANQKNAKRSTGPKTAEGKKNSSRNAQKTGVYAKNVLLGDEDDRALGQWRAQLYREWQPVGPTEKFYTEQLVGLMWRRSRFFGAEAGLITMHRECPGGTGGIATALDKDSKKNRALDRLLVHETHCDRGIERTLRQLRELQGTRNERAGLDDFLAESNIATVAPALPPAPS